MSSPRPLLLALAALCLPAALARHKPFDAFPEIDVELGAIHQQENPYHDGEYGDLVAVSLDPVATAGPSPTPLPPQDKPVIAECENFTVTGGAFNVTLWGQDHYFGATLSNTFVSRQALLHASNRSVGTAAGTATVPKAGVWYAIVRYEAPYRFSAEFEVTLKQGGAAKLSKLYGRRSSPKVWGFGYSLPNHEIGGCSWDPTPECHWAWGATENWVYEYYPVTLAAGAVDIALSVTNTSSDGDPLGDRNVDMVMLYQNLSDIQMRMQNEQR